MYLKSHWCVVKVSEHRPTVEFPPKLAGRPEYSPTISSKKKHQNVDVFIFSKIGQAIAFFFFILLTLKMEIVHCLAQ